MKVRVAVKQLRSSPEVGGVSIEDQNLGVTNSIIMQSVETHANGSAAMNTKIKYQFIQPDENFT